MSAPIKGEGSLKTPERHPLDWKSPEFYNEKSLFKDLERETEEKTSSVHFLRFELTPEMIAAAKEGAPFSMAIDHTAYRYQTDVLPEETRASLVKDLE